MILDTSVLIALSRNDKSALAVVDALRRHYPGVPCVAFMTAAEFLEGIELARPSSKGALLEFLSAFQMLQPTLETARILARLKVQYSAAGKKKGLADLFIASQAIEHRLPLVTCDRDFVGIKEVQCILVE